jgi:hypothetical protein
MTKSLSLNQLLSGSATDAAKMNYSHPPPVGLGGKCAATRKKVEHVLNQDCISVLAKLSIVYFACWIARSVVVLALATRSPRQTGKERSVLLFLLIFFLRCHSASDLRD